MIPLCYFNREPWWVRRQYRLRIMRFTEAIKAFQVAISRVLIPSFTHAVAAFEKFTESFNKLQEVAKSGEMKVNRGN